MLKDEGNAGFIKQIWIRMGTPGSTDADILYRTSGDNGVNWGKWYKVTATSYS